MGYDDSAMKIRMSTTLPLEVIGKIVNNLRDDQHALYKCSLLNSSWNYFAINLLWKSPNPSSLSAMKLFKKTVGRYKPSIIWKLLGKDGDNRIYYPRNFDLIREISLGGYEWNLESDHTAIGGLFFKQKIWPIGGAWLRTRFWCRLSKNLGVACTNLKKLDLSNCGKCFT